MYKKILVPTDFSAHSVHAFAHARGLAGALGAELIVLHVFDRPAPTGLHGAGGARDNYLDEAFEAAKERLRSWTKECAGSEASPEVELAAPEPALRCRAISCEGKPWIEVLAAIEREGCDLVCMASHGRGALADLLVGSVTERVLHRASCPVLVVRPEGSHWEIP